MALDPTAISEFIGLPTNAVPVIVISKMLSLLCLALITEPKVIIAL